MIALIRHAKLPFALAALVALLGALAYANTLRNGFVSDDRALILDHPYTKHFQDYPLIFRSGHYEGRGGYRPLTTFSFAINYAIGGENPVGYHFVNVTLHALTSALVLLLLTRILASRTAAFIAASIFALHPSHAEAVAWISGRAELLATFFFLLAWLFHLRGRHITGLWARPRILSAVALFAALLSKENALVFPIAVAAADAMISRWQSHWDALTGLKPWQRGLRLYWPSLIAICSYFVLRGLLYPRSIWRPLAKIHFVDNPLAHVSAFTRVCTAIKVQLEYFLLLLWPDRLCGDYSFNSVPLISTLADVGVICSLIAIAVLLLVAAVSFRRRGHLWFGIVFYGLTILPVSNLLVVIGTIKAERLLYLPSIGFCLLVACIGTLFYQTLKPRLRPIAAIVFALLLIAAGARTWARNPVWQDELTFWKSTAQDAPQNYKAQLIYGTEALKLGDSDEAISAFRKAREIDPNSDDATINLGAALIQSQRESEALTLYEEATRRNPNRAAYHCNLGLAYMANSQPASAVQHLERAVELDPANPAFHFNLGFAFSKTDDKQNALVQYRRALELKPDYAEAWNALGAVLFKQGQRSEAHAAFEKALEFKPGYGEALFNLNLLNEKP